MKIEIPEFTDWKEVFETLNGILYHVKPDDEIRQGEIHDIFRRIEDAFLQP